MDQGYATITLVGLLLGGLPALADDAATARAPDPCAYDRAAMMALDQDAFDQDLDGGWRVIANREGCEIAAADLIRDYREKHGLKDHVVTWHEGQMRALAGQTERAIELFEESRRPADVDDWFGWNYYVDATIAFLVKDKPALLEARDALAALPKPDDFNPVDDDGKPLDFEWPPNLHVIDDFIECFSKTYAQAYGNCQQPPGKSNKLE